MLVEVHRGLVKQKEHEDHYTDEKNDELHRDLQQPVEHQSHSRLSQGHPTQVTGYLRMVRAKVSQRKKGTTDNTRPDIVPVLQVKLNVHQVQLPELTRECYRVTERHVLRNQTVGGKSRCQHSGHNHRHLVTLRQAHSPRTTGCNVEDHENANHHRRKIQAPVEDCCKYDGGCIYRNAGRKSAQQEKVCRCKCSCLEIESTLEIFVCGVNFQAIVDRHECHRQDDHGYGQPEIDLDETHSIFDGLAGCGKEGDRTRLGGHDGDADHPPLHSVVALEVAFDSLAASCLPGSIGNNSQ